MKKFRNPCNFVTPRAHKSPPRNRALWLFVFLATALSFVFLVGPSNILPVLRLPRVAAVGGQSATHVLGPDNFTNADDWLTVAGLGTGIQAFAYDSIGQVLYGIGLGDVIRCDVGGTGCDDSGDWATSYSVTNADVSVTLDSVNRILYAGSSSGGIIVRCDIVATGCDESGDWATSYDTPFSRVSTLVVGDGIIYAGVEHSTNDTSVYRCNTTTVGSCNDSGDWTDITPASPAGGRIKALTYDGTNHVVYAGYSDGGVVGYILRCNFTGTSCDAGTDWTTTTGTSDPVRALTIDVTNSVIYAGTDNQIIRCDITATACDASGDWAVSFNSAHFSDSLVWDPTTQAIYSGDNNSNILYRCSIAETGCNSDGDWLQATANFVGGLALVRDSINNVLYSASSGPSVNRCVSSSGCNTTELSSPKGVAEDVTGHRLFVADASNNRVLVYDTSGFTDGQEPVNELGQADMNDVICNRFGPAGANTLCSPNGLAYDSANQRLFVSDTDNNRVLVYDVASITDGESAVHVLGQANFTNTGIPSEPGSSDLQVTRGLAYDSVHHRLFVSNSGACEVFVFDVTSITDGEAAVNVLGGNDDFSPGACIANDNSFNFPFGVAYDAPGDRLFVADRDNNRIMVFDVASITNDEPAVNVLGQSNFTSNSSGTNVSSLTAPADAAYYSSSASLFVADSNNNRVMVWDVSSIANGEDAVDVFGQTDFDSGGSATTQSSFNGPSGVALGTLLVSDASANRIMIFGTVATPTPIPTSTPAPIGGGGIVFGPTPTLSPTPSPIPKPAVGSIIINDEAQFTGSRYVTLKLTSPFGNGTTGMRLINAEELSPHDRDVLASLRQAQNSGQTTANGELQGGSRQKFSDTFINWDLCRGAVSCDSGQYLVYAQYTKPGVAAVVHKSFTAVGDVNSGAYYDSIQYAPLTPALPPTPSPVLTPVATPPLPTTTPAPGASPSPSVLPSPAGSPFPSGTAGPAGSPGPAASPPVSPSGIVGTVTGIVAGVATAVASGAKYVVKHPVDSAAAVSTVASVTTMAVALESVVTSASLLGNYVSYVLQYILGIFGIKKSRKPWGTVYDSATKQPISFAKLQLLDAANRVLETRIADRDGRYGFLVTPATIREAAVQVQVTASRPGFTFPSSRVTPPSDTILYSKIYNGGLVSVARDTPANFDIPMDPSGNRPGNSPVRLSNSATLVLNAGFWFGIVSVPLNLFLHPSPGRLMLLVLFCVLNAVTLPGLKPRPYGVVIDQTSGKPMPFALITLQDAYGRRVNFTVSDEAGRYFLLAQQGQYLLSVFTPTPVLPPRKTELPISTGQGWITKGVKV